MIGSAVLLPPLQARTVMGDGIASALYVSNYWFVLRRRRLLRHLHAAVAVPALLVVGRRGAVLPGVAGLDHRYGVAHPACASAHQGPMPPPRERPYLVVLALVAAVSFALSLAATYVVPPVAFFSLPTRAWQLAAGGLVALTAGQWRRLPPRAAAIAGWAGLGVILLACTRLGAATPYPGTAALLPVLGAVLVIGAGCAAPVAGMRPCAGSVADAGDRPGLLLVVPVALAGAACSHRHCWATRWGWPAGWQRSWSPAGWPCSPCVSSKTRCDSPLRYAGLPWAVSRWAVPPPR